MMNSIAMPTNLPAIRESAGLAVREIDDPDLYVNFVNNHPGHQQRIDDRRLIDARTRRSNVIPLRRRRA